MYVPYVVMRSWVSWKFSSREGGGAFESRAFNRVEMHSLAVLMRGSIGFNS